MEERALLLLGILMAQSQHGYQINEFIEMNLSRVTDMKKPTAYATLDRLGEAGYVQVHEEQRGNRPRRKVYTITESGRQHFLDLLRLSLATRDKMIFASDIGMMFLDHLAVEEAVSLIEHRLANVNAEIRQQELAPRHGFGLGVDLAIEHHLVHLKADAEWLNSVIARLREQREN